MKLRLECVWEGAASVTGCSLCASKLRPSCLDTCCLFFTHIPVTFCSLAWMRGEAMHSFVFGWSISIHHDTVRDSLKQLLFIQPGLKTKSLDTHSVVPAFWTPPLHVENHGAYHSRGECTQLTPLSTSVNSGMQTCQEHYSLWGFLVREGTMHEKMRTLSRDQPRGSFPLLCTDETPDWTALLISAETTQQLSQGLDQELFRASRL